MKDSFQNHVDNLFREMLQFHKKEPRRHVWENIEKELDKENKIALANKSKRGLKKISGLVLMSFFLSSTLLYYGVHLVLQERSVIAVNIKKSGTGKRTLKPIKSFPNGLVSIE